MTSETMVTRDTVCAGFLERFVAVLIDGLILLIPNLFLVYVIGGPVGYLIEFLLGIGYVLYFWTSSGSTPGKSLMGLKVVAADGGGIIPMSTAILRYIGTWISGVAFALGYLWVIWDSKHEAWHDKIASTKVIKIK